MTIITQNVDDLHERAGSSNVVHLHGKLCEARSTRYPDLVYDIGAKAIQWGDTCERGSQLRPNIVWFGEPVPKIIGATSICSAADIFAIIGTSLQVYPAAGLLECVPTTVSKYLIDPNPTTSVRYVPNLTLIAEKATIGVEKWLSLLHG